MSSDGYGSAARYDDQGNVDGLVASDLHTLAGEFRDLVREEGVPVEVALLPVTTNPARAFSLHPAKGELTPGGDADILIWDEDLRPHSLFARGALLLREGIVLRKGTFEHEEADVLSSFKSGLPALCERSATSPEETCLQRPNQGKRCTGPGSTAPRLC